MSPDGTAARGERPGDQALRKGHETTKKSIAFILISGALYGVFYRLLQQTPQTELTHHTFTHLPIIPFISAFFFFTERKTIFSHQDRAITAGSIIACAGIAGFAISYAAGAYLSPNNVASLGTVSIITLWTGLFVLFFGTEALKKARFPVLFLLFAVPIPLFILIPYVHFLQVLSTEAAHVIFMISGVTFVREGFMFHLPQVSIEVADVCSGIRSSIALFITGIMAGKLFLKKPVSKVILALAVFPITIIKNGLRISGLAILGSYVDSRILHSDIHREGGKPFFILALLLLGLILWALKRWEKGVQERKTR
ncbi:MAG: exosortase [Chitinivibrionales bacterium]|nr:exosortase [Chitinivibrionales bacterium]